MICNNTIISDRNNQAFSQVYIDQVNFFRGSMLSFNIPNKIRGRQKFTDLHAKVIDWLLGFIGRSPDVFVGYEFIATNIGVSIDTVEVAILRSVEMGALTREKKGRGYRYTLGEFFLHDYVVRALRWVLPSLYFAATRVKSRMKTLCLKVSSLFSTKLPLLITNVKKERVNTNTSLYIDTSKKGEIVPKNKIEEWLEPKVFEIVKHLMRIDVFMSEKTARYIAKYGEMSRIAREKWENARSYILSPKEKAEKIRLQEIQDTKDKIIFQKAALTAKGLQAEFLKYKL